MCLLIDPEAVLFDPDPKSRSGASARVIEYSPSVGAVVVILVRRADRTGAWWGDRHAPTTPVAEGLAATIPIASWPVGRLVFVVVGGSIIGVVSRFCRANTDSVRCPVDTAFMAQERGPVQELPAGCTLGPSRGEEQLRRWRALDGAHLLHRSRQPDELVVRYRADEVSRRELPALIDVEQECCRFVTWTVIDTDDELALVVRGSPADLDALSAGE